MKPTRSTAKPASMPKAGLRVSLGGLLRVQGTGASSSSTPRAFIFMLVMLGAALVALVCSVTPASAFQTRLYEESFGPDGTSATSFNFPWSLAVDRSSGGIYVAGWNETVRGFSSAHASDAFSVPFPSGFGFSERTQLAVDSSSHDVYVLGGDSVVRAYHADASNADFTAPPYVGTNEITGSGVCGVAVDGNGDIYVSESSMVRVLAPSGEQIASTSLFGACNLAVDSHGNVYVNYPFGGVEKLSPSEYPVTAGTIYFSAGTIDPNPSLSVAVDPATDHVLVDETGQVAEYDEAGALLGTFGAGGPSVLNKSVGIATNGASGAAQRVYVSDSEGGTRQVFIYGPAITLPDVTTAAASEINPKGSATLNGKVKPDGVALTECEFEYVEEARYEAGASEPYAAGAVAPCVPAAETIPTSSETEVTAEVTGLKPGMTYDYRLRASNKTASNKNPASFGANETVVFPPLPAIEAASASNLTEISAELSVKLNPGSLNTTYHFEYDTSPYAPGEPEGKHGTSIGAGELLANAGNTTIGPVKITELEANHTYHWRLVASNEAGTTTGVDHTFIYDTSGEGLPDNRAYELVTPPQKNGALIGDVAFGLQPEISEDGSRVMISSIQCFAGAESCDAKRTLASVGEPFLFSRTSTGWVTTALEPPASKFEADSSWMVSAETGTALFSMPTPPMFEDDLYVREPEGSFVDVGPLTPPSEGAQGPPFGSSGGDFEATSDFSRVAYAGREATYEYSGTGNTAPMPVGVSGGRGSTDLISACGAALGSGIREPGTMSADGETVYFTAVACEPATGANAETPVPVNEVYARIGEARTVAISEPQALNPAAVNKNCESTECETNTSKVDEENALRAHEEGAWHSASFAGASDDGSRAFFRSEQQLTNNASQAEGAEDENLYESECTASCEGPESEEKRSLIDVSEASGGAKVGGGPRVQAVVAISSDGSHVYFVAGGVLTTTPNARGATARDGANNLYVFERDANDPTGKVVFVTALPEADRELWGNNETGETNNITPDGRFLVFVSHGDLTPDATRTNGMRQIYRYDAQTGELARISIGEHGFNDNGNAGVGNAGIASAVLAWFRPGPSRSDPTMSHDGSYVFFESPIGLVPHALDDVLIEINPNTQQPVYAQNVYEWHEGQVYLISDGRDTALFAKGTASDVHLIGSDGTGANVFFTTTDPLAPRDTDTQMDYYDARICEPQKGNPCISPPPPPLPPCLGEACHGIPVAQPSAPSGGTLTLSGQGNLTSTLAAKRKPPIRARKLAAALKACHKKKGKMRGGCEKQAKKKYGAAKKKARKASHGRRAG